MITIQNLEVRFDVDGRDDEAAFAELFRRYMRAWERDAAERRRLEARLSAGRSLAGNGNCGGNGSGEAG
jgi:hypothetical protein